MGENVTNIPSAPQPEDRPMGRGSQGDSPSLRNETEELRATAEHLRGQVSELEVQARARPRIAMAEGVLVERYRLANAEAAFDLLRQASQRANIKLHQLAAAVARTPGPRPGAKAWFSGREQHPVPDLSSLEAGTLNPANQGEVLGAALQRVLTVTGTDMGNVQLLEDGVLRMAKHTGLSRQFTDFFAFVDGNTACSRAAAASNQVTVKDVASSAGFDDETRQVILMAGSRACHSIPLVDDQDVVRGVISSHHARPLVGFTQAQLQTLDTTSRTLGTWIKWHQHTVLVDALEDLHQLALATRQ
ncbi:GAF and ANTAR domain-containing protein [Streptomyces sp. NBC_01283]|uniref:ANTAR domain-containing protein n=1 Tax=Streptomyces sp. NBC_01283 TaxID=2903812 RepID=UPI00352D19BB|nr:GAF and ANTAR domain-containing protein [Streptomyces sp. NBC_01283]